MHQIIEKECIEGLKTLDAPKWEKFIKENNIPFYEVVCDSEAYFYAETYIKEKEIETKNDEELRKILSAAEDYYLDVEVDENAVAVIDYILNSRY